ncbi:MAG: hypothetical protein QXU54_01255 [Candidatus Micrarchaeia archaeon]
MPRAVIFGENHQSRNLQKIGRTLSPIFDKKRDVLIAEAWGAKSPHEFESPLKSEMYEAYRRVAAPIYGSLLGENLNAYRNARGLPNVRLMGLEPLLALDMMSVVDCAVNGGEVLSPRKAASLIRYGGEGISDEMALNYLAVYMWVLKCASDLGPEFKETVEKLSGKRIEADGFTQPVFSKEDYWWLVCVRSVLQAQSIMHYLNAGRNVYAICGMRHVKHVVDEVRSKGHYDIEIYLTEPAGTVANSVGEIFEIEKVKINFMN